MNSGRIERWLEEHTLLVDVGWAVLLLVTFGTGMTAMELDLPGWFLTVWVVSFFVPMALRRRAPDAATALLVVALLVQVLVVDEVIPPDIVVPFVVYGFSAYGRPRWRRWWLAAALFGAAYSSVDWSHGHTHVDAFTMVFGTLTAAAVVLASYLLGALARQRRENLTTLRSRAELLEREREQGLRLAAQEERARIAREMHDIVAHSLSVIVVQADGARYLAAQSDPTSPAVAALDTIGGTARTALAETRRLVGVLREEGADAELAPAASLAQVADLVAQSRAAGLPVTYSVAGTPEPLGASVEMALYRVAQEALTNVLKHAGPGAAVSVEVAHEPASVTVAVRNTGAVAAGGDGAGHGLVGMRERMAAHGGTLRARPLLGGGFEVVATVPRTPIEESP